MTTHDYRAEADRAVYVSSYEESRGAGWVGFATIMLALAGTWNMIQGILAIADSRIYVANSVFVFSDLKTWGWIVTILGVIQLVAAFTILSGSEFGRWLGIGAAFLNSMGQLFFLPAYPFWALTMFTVDLIIIYALAVYAGKRLQAE